MKQAKKLQGCYGRSHIPCIVFEYKGWYCIKGCVNVSHTTDITENGVDVETLHDDDFFTADKPVNCIEDLKNEVEEYINE